MLIFNNNALSQNDFNNLFTFKLARFSHLYFGTNCLLISLNFLFSTINTNIIKFFFPYAPI